MCQNKTIKMMLFQQQQQARVDENMSNLTSASCDQASVTSSGNRAEIGTSNGFSQQYFASPPPQSQPPKKKRNLPGNPGEKSSAKPDYSATFISVIHTCMYIF